MSRPIHGVTGEPGKLAIGQRIADLRTRKQLSQEQLAVHANVSRSSVQAAERGEASKRTLQRLADALGVSLDTLTHTRPRTTGPAGPDGTVDLSALSTTQLVTELYHRITAAPTAGGLRIVAEDGRGWHDLNPDDQEQLRRAIDAATRRSDGETPAGRSEPPAQRPTRPPRG
jgi:transcriptional regulator with XRE-family HTH domain